MAAGSDNRADSYSFLDRCLHRLAFAHPIVQRALGEIESDIFARQYADQSSAKPVFVTGLPRAGTTLLLELLYKTGEFSTFTYREMPFVLAPLLWASMTKSGRREGALKERAHGDGMEISFDSPEAFEEVAWLTYLREKYVGDENLKPVGADMVSSEFKQAFETLVRKLAAVHAIDGAPLRYISKNNANISRIGAVRAIFPDATVFVCIRDPVSHVRSLKTQHERFLSLHETDEFARSYMRWIGHYDFGANFRPIDFAGRGYTARQAGDPNFWLQYWIDAYAYAAKRADERVHFVSYERTISSPAEALRRIADLSELSDKAGFAANAAAIRAPTTRNAPLDGADQRLLAEANAAYALLTKGDDA
ncbi:MAG: sulfotransferase [Parvularculaceae bacterium]|nr:sulfotransferase [Parvularculaceae bacterium]